MPRSILLVVIFNSILLLSSSCSLSTSRTRHQKIGIGEIETRHWIHSEHLRTVMASLEQEALSSWPQEVENEYAIINKEKSKRSYQEAQTLAKLLANTAPQIIQATVEFKLSEADYRGFVAQADTLKEQAQRLHQAATGGDIDRMRQELKSIRATCRSCHERYRDISGPIDNQTEHKTIREKPDEGH